MDVIIKEYILMHSLFHGGGPCRRSLSKVPSPMICRANQWTGFYMIGTSIMKELRRSSPIILRKSVFFLSGFLSRIFTIHRTAGERRGYLLISFLPLPLALQTLRHKPGHCYRELTSAHSWQPDSNRESLVS